MIFGSATYASLHIRRSGCRRRKENSSFGGKSQSESNFSNSWNLERRRSPRSIKLSSSLIGMTPFCAHLSWISAIRRDKTQTKTDRTIPWRILFISFFTFHIISVCFLHFVSELWTQLGSGVDALPNHRTESQGPSLSSARRKHRLGAPSLASKDIEAASKKLLELAKRMVSGRCHDFFGCKIALFCLYFFHRYFQLLKLNSFQSSDGNLSKFLREDAWNRHSIATVSWSAFRRDRPSLSPMPWVAGLNTAQPNGSGPRTSKG